MRITSTMHNHCTYCDGKSSPEEMIEAAIKNGFTDFGMSCHGYAPFDMDYSIPSEEVYISGIAELKDKYGKRIKIYCGIEQDYYSTCSEEDYDYRIASLHYIRDYKTDTYHIVDGTPEDLISCRNLMFGGDGLAMAEKYYETLTDHVTKSSPDIIGHFDVLTKCNGVAGAFDETSHAYRDLAVAALEVCAKSDGVFEVNTGGMAGGHISRPYPDLFLLRRLAELGGRVILTTDCHHANMITYGFDAALEAVRSAGFKSIYQYTNGVFIEDKI